MKKGSGKIFSALDILVLVLVAVGCISYFILESDKYKTRKVVPAIEACARAVIPSVDEFELYGCYNLSYEDTQDWLPIKVTFKTEKGYVGTTQMKVRMNDELDEVSDYKNVKTEFSQYRPDIPVFQYEYPSYDDGVVFHHITIPARYDEDDLCKIADYVMTVENDFRVGSYEIEVYLSGWSRFGMNYAVISGYASGKGISAKVEMNQVTSLNGKTGFSKDVLSKRSDCPFRYAEILGHYQYVGPSTLTVYRQGNSYYMVTFADDAFEKPDRLRLISKNHFRGQDPNETFRIEEDGLYCYYDDNLGGVYHIFIE